MSFSVYPRNDSWSSVEPQAFSSTLPFFKQNLYGMYIAASEMLWFSTWRRPADTHKLPLGILIKWLTNLSLVRDQQKHAWSALVTLLTQTLTKHLIGNDTLIMHICSFALRTAAGFPRIDLTIFLWDSVPCWPGRSDRCIFMLPISSSTTSQTCSIGYLETGEVTEVYWTHCHVHETSWRLLLYDTEHYPPSEDG